MKNALELVALQWTMNRFACHLLPPRSSFIVTHDEVLVVDAREPEVQRPSFYCRFPHQTGVTERSIGGHDRHTANRVHHDVVITHQPDRISYRLFTNFDCQHTIVVADEIRVR
jgi:hypothetical protein